VNLAWIIALMAAAAPHGPAAAAPNSALTCAVTTPEGKPLIFEPGVGLTPKRVSARGNLQLTGCTSPDGSAPYLRSGWLTLKGSARNVRGTARITWFGVDGRPVGTSEVQAKADRLATQSPADTLLSGSVTSGPLVGERVRGGISPAIGLLSCATTGIDKLPGAGHITFG
jgi:hypothetical protein